MKKVLFLCHGNICRSPIAEFVFKEISKGYDVYAESKAVSRIQNQREQKSLFNMLASIQVPNT